MIWVAFVAIMLVMFFTGFAIVVAYGQEDGYVHGTRSRDADR